jgi:anti-sigma factor RsiW
MSDCTNGELRDLLPELMHGRLDAHVQRAVEAHVAVCPVCAEELALLRSLRTSLTRGPLVDARRIAAAVNVRVSPASARAGQRKRTPWRIALAAAALLAASGVGYAVVSRDHARAPEVAVTTQRPAPRGDDSGHIPRVIVPPIVAPSPRGAPMTPKLPPEVAVAPPHVAAPTTAPTTVTASAGVLGNLSDLSDDDVRALTASLDGLSSVPDAESAPVVDPLGASLDDVSAGGS